MIASLGFVLLATGQNAAMMAAPELGPSGFAYYIKNNSNIALSCRGRRPSGNWTGFITRGAGGEWAFDTPSEGYRLHCKAPVRQLEFKLEPGELYSLQRRPPGGPVIELVRISAD